jgi:hypothetical protein
MNKARIVYFIFFFLILTSVPGHTVPDSTSISLGYPVYSQYLQNGLVINPAYAGTRGILSGFVSYRMQWMGINGSPSLQTVSLHTPMKNDKHSSCSSDLLNQQVFMPFMLTISG